MYIYIVAIVSSMFAIIFLFVDAAVAAAVAPLFHRHPAPTNNFRSLHLSCYLSFAWWRYQLGIQYNVHFFFFLKRKSFRIRQWLTQNHINANTFFFLCNFDSTFHFHRFNSNDFFFLFLPSANVIFLFQLFLLFFFFFILFLLLLIFVVVFILSFSWHGPCFCNC